MLVVFLCNVQWETGMLSTGQIFCCQYTEFVKFLMHLSYASFLQRIVLILVHPNHSS